MATPIEGLGGSTPLYGAKGTQVAVEAYDQPTRIPIKRASTPLMQAKVLTTRGMHLVDTASDAMANIGPILIGVNAPLAVWNTYRLATGGVSQKERREEMAKTSANYLLAASGGAMLGSVKGGAAAMKAAVILGPIGLAILSGLSLVRGAKAGVEAYQAHLDLRAAATEQERVAAIGERRAALATLLKSVLIGVGLALGGAVMGGLLASPVGWAALGLVVTGLVIHVGTALHQRYKEKYGSEGITTGLQQSGVEDNAPTTHRARGRASDPSSDQGS